MKAELKYYPCKMIRGLFGYYLVVEHHRIMPHPARHGTKEQCFQWANQTCLVFGLELV